MSRDTWVLGATGRMGRAIASRLVAAGAPVVLVGRDAGRLTDLQASLDGSARTVAAPFDDALATMAQNAPAVVINTVGPFTRTAVQVARACPPGTHYVDLGNEYPAAAAILGLHEDAVATRRTLVTGAGFGVAATESVLLRVCAGRPQPLRVRVDAVASVAIEPGAFGSALASTIVDGLAFGGRQVASGRLIRSWRAEPMQLTTPDGDNVVTGSAPTAELLVAWRASGADSVVAASTYGPTSLAARLGLPLLSAVVRVPAIAQFAAGRLAAVKVTAKAGPRQHSWAHASAEWPAGDKLEAWLRAPDGSDFTAAVATDVALRLARGEGKPGAYPPGALFGTAIAVNAGGVFVDGAAAASQ